MTRAAACLLAAAAACGAAGAALAGDTGALDVEVRNRAVVSGAIGAPQELDTLRLRIPEGAALQVSVVGSGKVRPLVRVLGTDDAELDLGGHLVHKGKAARITGFAPGPAGLYRIDVRAEGAATGNYKLTASWTLPVKETFSGATDDLGAFYVFDAEAGTRVGVKLATADAGASVRAVRVLGPNGYVEDFATPPPSAKHHVRMRPLPATGRYQLDLVTDIAGRNVTGTLARTPPAKTSKSNLRRGERRGKGVARTVSRLFDTDGGAIDVPRLDVDQRVSLDATGVCLAIPGGALPFPSIVDLHTDDEAIGDPLGFAPAGVSVHFNAGGAPFATPVQISLPYDVGAFSTGNVFTDICLLRLADDGMVFELPRSTLVVDEGAGMVSFPTSQFSSYQVFSPPVEVVPIADVGSPNDLAVAPDGAALYLSTDVLMAGNPAAAVMRYVPGGALELYAGGGVDTGDFVPALDYDFDHDLGFTGVLLSALATDDFGNVLVVTGDLARTRSVAYLVTTAGLVVRIAGDGTSDLDESLPARDTGLPFCCGAAFRADGNAYVVTDSFLYPVSDRVLAIVAEGSTLDSLTVTTVAGGGTVDVSGSPPLATRLLQPRAVTVDSQGRVLVGDRDWLVRFDLAADTTTTLAGTNFGETDAGGGAGRTIGGIGAPLRTVVLGALDDLAFAPGREDLLYAADPEAGIVWRFDLDRDRAFVAAGRRVDFDRRLTTRRPDPDAADPGEVLSFPSAVAPLGGEVFIAERFDDRLFTLRRR